MSGESVNLPWRVHIPNFLKEIAECSGNEIYRIPINILSRLLAQVAERAIELDDPKLNTLMCRMTLYSAADPMSPDYNPECARAIQRAAEKEAKG